MYMQYRKFQCAEVEHSMVVHNSHSGCGNKKFIEGCNISHTYSRYNEYIRILTPSFKNSDRNENDVINNLLYVT